MLALAASLGMGCPDTSPPPEFPQCVLELDMAPTQGAPGTLVLVTGGPLTNDAYDYNVRVGGTRATVVDVSRNDACLECDVCQAQTEPPCDGCETCYPCWTSCNACVCGTSSGRSKTSVRCATKAMTGRS